MNTVARKAAPVKTTRILFSGQARTNRTFGQGVYLQKADRLPIGPNDADRAWAASALNADTTAYSTEDGDWQTHEARTVSRREWLALQTELATERFVDACNAISDRLEARREPEEAEVAEAGSQVGHADDEAAREAAIERELYRPWAYVKDANWRTSEAFAAKYNAEKAARKAKEAARVAATVATAPVPETPAVKAGKPRPATLHQKSRAARLARDKAATA